MGADSQSLLTELKGHIYALEKLGTITVVILYTDERSDWFTGRLRIPFINWFYDMRVEVAVESSLCSQDEVSKLARCMKR